MKETFKKQISSAIQKNGNRPLPYQSILQRCKPSDAKEKADFNQAISELETEGVIFKKTAGYVSVTAMGAFAATVVRVHKTFGFIRRQDDETDVFIPGRYLMGAMPGDFVLAKLIPSRTGSPEGELIKIVTPSTARFTGVILEQFGKRMIQPDTLCKTPLLLTDSEPFAVGNKVLAEISYRGSRHSEHKAKTLASFGSSDKASCCAQSILAMHGITQEFPPEVLEEAERIGKMTVTPEDIAKRLDLRDQIIFTIDSADTKDIDDAISLAKTDRCWELGVHIADVSHYVKPGAALDDEAFRRGTSIYYADKVIPMLPKALSNGICSLNPQVERLAFSCMMQLDFDGNLTDYRFAKSVIRSHVKGVYAEINQIYDQSASPEILEKYKDCLPTLQLMHELSEVLTRNKNNRGAPQLETTESKLILDENQVCVDVKARSSGFSEGMIEEFMLMANTAAAKMGTDNGLPFVYRIHENPPLEKTDSLKETLTKLYVPFPPFEEVKPKHLADILESQREKPLFAVINRLVLRSMAKAKYSTEPIGHFGLVLKDYAHFTSPIRRYPDLSIHRILSDFLAGKSKSDIVKRYSGFVVGSAEHSTETEMTSMRIERSCEDCFKAEYMTQHVGETFTGVISGAVEYGLYVELPNTVEGLVHVSTLPEGEYSFDGVGTLQDTLSGRHWTMGQKVQVLCTKADVSGGKIDFSLIEEA